MSGFTEDIETYLWLCKRFDEEVQYKQCDENKVPDVYGKHAIELWERFRVRDHSIGRQTGKDEMTKNFFNYFKDKNGADEEP